jgi:hypothetical protein
MVAGTGTTPTLMGTEYVTIVDKALPQMHVLVYCRSKDSPWATERVRGNIKQTQ